MAMTPSMKFPNKTSYELPQIWGIFKECTSWTVIPKLVHAQVYSAAKMVKNGSHDELIAHGGKYARLFAAQSRHYRSSSTSEDIC
jgi:hypothetical protein